MTGDLCTKIISVMINSENCKKKKIARDNIEDSNIVPLPHLFSVYLLSSLLPFLLFSCLLLPPLILLSYILSFSLFSCLLSSLPLHLLLFLPSFPLFSSHLLFSLPLSSLNSFWLSFCLLLPPLFLVSPLFASPFTFCLLSSSFFTYPLASSILL